MTFLVLDFDKTFLPTHCGGQPMTKCLNTDKDPINIENVEEYKQILNQLKRQFPGGLYISTRGIAQETKDYLKAKGLSNFFKEVYGAKNLNDTKSKNWNKRKAQVLNQILKKEQSSDRSLLYYFDDNKDNIREALKNGFLNSVNNQNVHGLDLLRLANDYQWFQKLQKLRSSADFIFTTREQKRENLDGQPLETVAKLFQKRVILPHVGQSLDKQSRKFLQEDVKSNRLLMYYGIEHNKDLIPFLLVTKYDPQGKKLVGRSVRLDQTKNPNQNLDIFTKRRNTGGQKYVYKFYNDTIPEWLKSFVPDTVDVIKVFSEMKTFLQDDPNNRVIYLAKSKDDQIYSFVWKWNKFGDNEGEGKVVWKTQLLTKDQNNLESALKTFYLENKSKNYHFLVEKNNSFQVGPPLQDVYRLMKLENYLNRLEELNDGYDVKGSCFDVLTLENPQIGDYFEENKEAILLIHEPRDKQFKSECLPISYIQNQLQDKAQHYRRCFRQGTTNDGNIDYASGVIVRVGTSTPMFVKLQDLRNLLKNGNNVLLVGKGIEQWENTASVKNLQTGEGSTYCQGGTMKEVREIFGFKYDNLIQDLNNYETAKQKLQKQIEERAQQL